MTRSIPKSTGHTRAKKPTIKKTGRTLDQTPSIPYLRAVQKAEVDKYTTVKNTSTAYNGYLARGRGFLINLVSKRRSSGEADVCREGIPTDELEKAFDKPPNRWSAFALELFLVEKCFNDNCGKSTADGIHGAFTSMWDNMDGDRYAGEYRLDEKTGEVRGCPARAPCVKAVVKSVKTRAKSKGEAATRNHADAITLEEIQKLMQWSEQECPNELLTDISNVNDIDALRHRLEHGFMRAFMTSAFTLWTRCFELLSLQANDIEDNCHGPAPYYIPHFKVHLTDRKGWQHAKGYDGPRTSNIYDIYGQDIPEIDMNTHFLRWRNLLEAYLGSPLKPNDFLFPHLAVNGVIRSAREMSYDSLQGLLSKFCDGAGIQTRYTTHSFRRGGAQYRFMLAPMGERWSLNRIRWWGGWAVGEHVDTLIKYLVDSLQSYENGHGNALHPISIEADESFMGDHKAVKPVTTEELRQLGASFDRKMDTVLTAVYTVVQPQPVPHPCRQTEPGVHMSTVEPVLDTKKTLLTTVQPFGLLLPSISANGATESWQAAAESSHYPIQSPTVKPARKRPIPNISIPALGRAPGAWRRAIKQWEEKDPSNGNLALKDWPVEWYTGEMRTITGSKRSQRQVVFDEYVRLGCDENRFLELYPNADRSMADLLSQIRANSMKSRRSKNGMPEERGLRGITGMKAMPLDESDFGQISDFHGSEDMNMWLI